MKSAGWKDEIKDNSEAHGVTAATAAAAAKRRARGGRSRYWRRVALKKIREEEGRDSAVEVGRLRLRDRDARRVEGGSGEEPHDEGGRR